MLEFDGLWKSFGERPVLRGLEMTVRPGEIRGFCGANGAGKTTAMRIALGIVNADAGTVRWNGRCLGPAERERIGYMPEERGLYGRMEPVEQLVYLARLSGARRGDARGDAQRWVERMGVRMSPRDTLDKLSLGNQQKVQLIAALIHRPDLLILDEPFSGLDPLAVDSLSTVLAEVAATGVPVLFSSHQLDLVERLCDRVTIMSAGVVVADGPVAALRGTGVRRLELTLRGAAPGWAQRLPTCRVVESTGTSAVAEIDADTPLDAVVAAAQRQGTIEHLSVVEPTLTDIFRDVVVPT